MSKDMQLVRDSDRYPQFTSGRRTLCEEWQAAAKGLPAQQATNDPAALMADAQIIQADADKLTRKIAKALGGVAEMGPEKDLYRVLNKLKGKEGGQDASYNCDFSRSRILLGNKTQIRNALDMFSEPGTIELKDGTRIIIREVENNFSTFNRRKAGIANLDVKITFEFTTDEGERSYHHHELQFIPKPARSDYERSHDAYKRKRLAQIYRDGADNALAVCGDQQDAHMWSKKWAQYDADIKSSNAERLAIHQAVRDRLGLDEFLGYQPCTSSRSKRLDNPGAVLYVVQ